MDSPGGNVVLRKRISEAFAGSSGICQLLWRGWDVGILKSGKQLLEARKHDTDAVLELLEVVESALVGGVDGSFSGEVGLAEDGAFAVFTHAHVYWDLVWSGLFGRWVGLCFGQYGE